MNESRRQILLDTPHTETATGAIASFETDMVGRAKEVKVEIEPVQEGTPWIADTTESVPYNFRAVKGNAPRIGNSIFESVVGGTVAWNQWVPIKSSASNYNSNGAHITDNRDGSYTFYTDETGATSNILYQVFQIVDAVIPGHVYMLAGNYPHDNGATTWRLVDAYNVALPWPTTKAETLFKNQRTTIARMDCRIQIFSGTIIATPITVRPQVFDLTQMFGTAVADYLSSLETATPDAGVAYFRKLFPKDYYPYDAGSLKSVEGLQSHDTVGFNAWDEEWEIGGINSSNGQNMTNTHYLRAKNLFRVVPGATYCFRYGKNIGAGNNMFKAVYYDADKQHLSLSNYSKIRFTDKTLFKIPDDATYMRFQFGDYSDAAVVTGYDNQICINLSDPARNGEYEPYTKHSYPLDDSLTLRGIPKLDANNNLYYDGDTYESDGTVTRRYGVVDMGTLTWVSNGQDSVFANLPTKKVGSRNVICDKLTYSPAQSISSVPYNGFRTYDASNGIAVRVSGITPGNAKDNLSGMMLVYELATPTTESADPFQSPQVIDEYGTEEYVYSGTRDVAIPVGHVTRHADIYPISGWDGANVQMTGKNMLDPATIRNGYYVRAGNVTESSSLGSEVATTSPWSCSDFIPVLASAQYTTIAPRYTSASAAGLVFYDESKNAISGVTTNQQRDAIYTFTTPSDCKYVRFSWNNADGDNALIAAGIATAYEPFHGSTTPISWTDEVGTVYGGTITWKHDGTVTLTKTMASVDMGDLTWTYRSANTVFSANKSDMPLNSLMVCTCYSPNRTASTVGQIADKQIWNRANAYGPHNICVKDTTYTDAASFKTSVTGQKIVYTLETPVTYTLTPQQALVFLRGTNNVWNDINDTTVTYWTHKTGDSV